jgi:protein-S-isoprenylcysteine O-methyltransferase Ste14
MTSQKSWWQGPRGEGYVIIQVILFALVGAGPKEISALPLWDPPWSSIGLGIGLLLGLIGAGLILLGFFSLGPNLTPFPRPRDNNTLVETGVYGLVRHPIYGGIILGAVGWACLFGSTLLTLIYALILFLFFDIKSRQEEKWLTDKHPQYRAYQHRVRKLLPFIY